MKNNVRAIRQDKNLTLEQLAKLAGTSKSYIWDLETNEANPSIKLVYRISNALDSTIGEVFPDDQE